MLFLSILLILQISRITFCDECENFNSFWTRENALNCVRSVEFSEYESTFSSILEDLSSPTHGQLLDDYYIYRAHIKSGSGEPYNIKIDIDEETQSLSTTSFTSWYDAQKALAKVWRENRDYHSMWKMDYLFYALHFFHPIAIGTYLNEDGVQKFNVRNNDLTEQVQQDYNLLFGSSIDFESLDGMDITQINNMSAMEYLKEFTNTNWFWSRDKSTNLNEMLRRFSAINPVTTAEELTWYMRSSRVTDIPEPITYEFKNESETVTLTIDWISCFIDHGECYNITSTDDLKSLIAAPIQNNSRRGEEEEKTERAFPNFHENDSLEMKGTIERMREVHAASNRRDVSYTMIGSSPNGEFYAFYLNEHPEVAIFQLVTMHIIDSNTSIPAYVAALAAVEQGNFSKVIIDLRQNEGGMIGFAMSFGKALMKTTVPEPKDMTGPLLVTDKMFKAFEIGGAFEHFNSWIYKGNTKRVSFTEIDGTKNTYPPYIRFDGDYETYETWPNLRRDSGFSGVEPEDLIIITTGSCGSACGMFTKMMNGMKAAKVYLFGGFADQEEMDLSSFDGASVEKIASNGHTLAFSWAAMFPWGYNEMYDKSLYDLTQFVGFKYNAPDFRILEWEGIEVDEFGAIETTIQNIDNCTEWNIKIDDTCTDVSIEHGIYGRPCENGEYIMDAPCVIKRCEDEYYLNVDKTKCLPIDQAPVWTIFDQQQQSGSFKTNFNIEIFFLVCLLCFIFSGF